MNFSHLTDKEVFEAFERAWVESMYYNAAEREWSRAESALNRAQERYYALQKEIADRGYNHLGEKVA